MFWCIHGNESYSLGSRSPRTSIKRSDSEMPLWAPTSLPSSRSPSQCRASLIAHSEYGIICANRAASGPLRAAGCARSGRCAFTPLPPGFGSPGEPTDVTKANRAVNPSKTHLSAEMLRFYFRAGAAEPSSGPCSEPGREWGSKPRNPLGTRGAGLGHKVRAPEVRGSAGTRGPARPGAELARSQPRLRAGCAPQRCLHFKSVAGAAQPPAPTFKAPFVSSFHLSEVLLPVAKFH